LFLCVENDDDDNDDVDCVHVVRLLDFKPVTFQVSTTLALVRIYVYIYLLI